MGILFNKLTTAVRGMADDSAQDQTGSPRAALPVRLFIGHLTPTRVNWSLVCAPLAAQFVHDVCLHLSGSAAKRYVFTS